MGEVTIQRFRRRPEVFDARRISRENAKEVARWCRGTPLAGGVRVPVMVGGLSWDVHATPGMWVVMGRKGEPEVYTDIEFYRHFEAVVNK